MTGFMGGVDDAEGFSGAGSLESFIPGGHFESYESTCFYVCS